MTRFPWWVRLIFWYVIDDPNDIAPYAVSKDYKVEEEEDNYATSSMDYFEIQGNTLLIKVSKWQQTCPPSIYPCGANKNNINSTLC